MSFEQIFSDFKQQDLTDKQQKYINLLKVAQAVLADENNLIANMANLTALLKEAFGWYWVGFYLVDEASNQLVLGPFQGSLACTRIGFGKGVCGTAWQQKRTIIVDDVNKFPGHIACSSNSLSEIVVPVFVDEKIIAVLDVDADKLAQFDQIDLDFLQQIVSYL